MNATKLAVLVTILSLTFELVVASGVASVAKRTLSEVWLQTEAVVEALK